MHKIITRVIFGCCAIYAGAAIGQDTLSPVSKSVGPIDRTELAAFIDGLMEAYLAGYHTAGATVSVVQNGEMIFAKGYGKADVEADIDVEASTTLFRIGSVSKLFVWTSVMQLVEQGLIDLDADVNKYITGFQIPATYDKPITMASLMAHAPGFEDHVIGLFAHSEDKLAPLGDLVRDQLPKRVRPPMVESAYSNHGTALAAYIVECVSGQEWNDYVEEHVFKPLGMEHTTFRQPLPEALAPDMSKGYKWNGVDFEEEGFEFVPIAPAGSVSATSTDLANFMIAHLQDGRFWDKSILKEATARQMHSELFQHADGINAMAHGFYEMNRNGQRIIGHGGDTLLFHSQLALFLDHNLGFFVSFNSQEGGQATGKFTEAFIDRYFPVDDAPDITPNADAVAQLDRFTGAYTVNRYSHTSLAKLALLMQPITIAKTKDGNALTFSETGKKRWIPVEPLLFREEDGYDTIAFRTDDQGRVTSAFIGQVPVFALERADAWYRLPFNHAMLEIAAIFVFLVTIVRWPIHAFIRWRYGVDTRPSAVLPFATRAVGWLGAFVFAAFILGLAVIMASDPQQIVFGIPPALQVLLVLPIIGAALTVLAFVCAVRAWIYSHGTLFGRTRYTLLTLLFVAVLAQLYYWNLLGFKY